MAAEDTKPDTLTLLCPECRELLEVSDPHTILLAHHLDNFCPETEGLLHP